MPTLPRDSLSHLPTGPIDLASILPTNLSAAAFGDNNVRWAQAREDESDPGNTSFAEDAPDLAIFTVGLNHDTLGLGPATTEGMRALATKIVKLWPDLRKPLVVVISQSTYQPPWHSTGAVFFSLLGQAYGLTSLGHQVRPGMPSLYKMGNDQTPWNATDAPLQMMLSEAPSVGGSTNPGVILGGVQFANTHDSDGGKAMANPTFLWKDGDEVVALPGPGDYGIYATAEVDLRALGFATNLGIVAVRYHTLNKYARAHQAFVSYAKTHELRATRNDMPVLVAGDFNATLNSTEQPGADDKWSEFFRTQSYARTDWRECRVADTGPDGFRKFNLFFDIMNLVFFDGIDGKQLVSPVAWAYDARPDGLPAFPEAGITVPEVGHSMIGGAFRIGPKPLLWHTRRRADGTWTGAGKIKGQFTVPGPVRALAATGGNPGETQLLLATDDGHLWHTIRHPDETWSKLGDVNALLGFPGPTRSVAATTGGPGETQFLFATEDGHLWHTLRRSDGSWAAFGDVNVEIGSPGPVRSVAATMSNPEEAQFLFATEDGHLWHTLRRPDGSWTPLGDVNVEIGFPGPVRSVAATTSDPGEAQFLFATEDGHLWHTVRRADGSWTPFGMCDQLDRFLVETAIRARRGRPGEVRHPRIWSSTDGLLRQLGS